MSVRELRAELARRGVSSAGCTEKAELVALLESAPPVRREAEADVTHSHAQSASARNANTDPAVDRVLACGEHELFRILDVPSSANADDLKKAYRVLALRLHPDKCAARGADAAFKRVSAAYAVLSDPRQRAAHVLGGGSSNGSSVGRGYSPNVGRGFSDTDAEELFRAFFGGDAPASSSVPTGRERPGSVVDGTVHAVALGRRLCAAFVRNPWTLVTLLSALASLVSIFESLVAILGSSVAVAALPAAAVGIYVAPPHRRGNVAMAVAALLFSGLLL